MTRGEAKEKPVLVFRSCWGNCPDCNGPGHLVRIWSNGTTWTACPRCGEKTTKNKGIKRAYANVNLRGGL